MKKNTKLVVITTAILGLISPAFTHALSESGGSSTLFNSNSTLGTVIDSVIKMFNSLIPLLIGAAVVVFLYGVLIFIAKASAGNAEGRKEGINFMIYGIIGIAVMVSLWGLVAFVTTTFGTANVIPQFKST